MGAKEVRLVGEYVSKELMCNLDVELYFLIHAFQREGGEYAKLPMCGKV
jgi:hypothetical protein